MRNKNKNKRLASPSSSDNNSNSNSLGVGNDRTADNKRRCDEVTRLLLDGKEGDELERAVQNMDYALSFHYEPEQEEREQGVMDEY